MSFVYFSFTKQIFMLLDIANQYFLLYYFNVLPIINTLHFFQLFTYKYHTFTELTSTLQKNGGDHRLRHSELADTKDTLKQTTVQFSQVTMTFHKLMQVWLSKHFPVFLVMFHYKRRKCYFMLQLQTSHYIVPDKQMFNQRPYRQIYLKPSNQL